MEGVLLACVLRQPCLPGRLAVWLLLLLPLLQDALGLVSAAVAKKGSNVKVQYWRWEERGEREA